MQSESFHSEVVRIKKGGASKAHEKNAEAGKLFVRERIQLLVDEGSFVEDGLFANALHKDLPADGVITGTATVEGRPVALMANDSTIKAGSWGARTVEKIIRIQEVALRLKVPMLYLVDSAGAHITDQLDMFPGRRHAGTIFHMEVALSGLAAGVCVTVLMSSVFRLGIRQGTRKRFALASTTLDDITEFLESQGRLWGARHEPVRRAELVGWQVVEALTSHHLVAGPLSEIEVETGFDEYIFTLIVRYRGGLLPLAKQPPSAEELMASTEAELQMAGYLVSQSAHSARASSNADGLCTLRLTFEN